jgi:CRP-like cAMP-binding protein
MAIPGELYLDHPVRPVAAGDVVVAEGERSGTLFVVGSGEFEVTRQGSTIATITEPGSVIGEGSVLLDTPHGATVTAAPVATWACSTRS